ncbi:hypothetical protein BaRGS_00012533 [Batillaria attramentaria]|uniref:TIR domain-containing protein n=1 Tax=Batillaria attramentaria TaxID=370345 RepID=A0ABD0LA80_9CAEN
MTSSVLHTLYRVVLPAVIILPSLPVTSPKCIFQEVTNNDTHAQCSHRRLTKLPATWPGHVVSLDVSHNFLTNLAGLNNPYFTDLRSLDISYNSITTVPDDAFQHVPQLEELDLSDNVLLNLTHNAFRGLLHLTRLALRHTGLHALPDTLLIHVPQLDTLELSQNSLSTVPFSALRHVTSLTSLDLASNNLVTMTNHSLVELSQLRTLGLWNNQLSSLEPAAFSGLRQLLQLDLSYNNLLLDHQAYPSGVFSPLVALQSLRINNNDDRNEGRYPENVLTLPSLRNLSIDVFRDAQFGEAFSSLTSLTSLTFDQICYLKHLKNDTFAAFKKSFLEVLHIECELTVIETCTFCNFPHLKTLRVSFGRHITTGSFLLALYGLQNQTMSEITITSNDRAGPTVLEARNTKFLNNVCVNKLNIHGHLTGLKSDAFYVNSPLDVCLQHLDLSENSIKSVPGPVVWKLATILFRNIITCSFRNQMFYHSHRINDKTSSDDREYYEPLGPNAVIHVRLPPSLEVLDASSGTENMGYLPSYLDVPTGGNLTTLNASYVGIWTCMTTITGLTALRSLDLSGNNDCVVLSEDIFDHMSTLQCLRLADMRLDQRFIMENGTRVLRTLGLLERLDLSDNDLYRLPPDMLRAQPRLQTLALTGNRFQKVPTDLSLQTHLSVLDLSDNMLPTLLPHERRLLDTLAKNHTLQLRLRNNPLSCTCSGLDFLLGLVLTFVISRNWTYVRYAWRVLRHLQLPKRLDFRKDVLLGHADADLELAMRVGDCLRDEQGVRVLLPYEEILPGDIWTEKILQLVDDSWKILLLVTRELLQDRWAGFLVNHAQRSISDIMPDRVIVVFMEQPANLAQGPPDHPARVSMQRLLRMVPERNVFHVHRDIPPNHPVWDRLTQLIQQQ